jgi:hypothetical protein
MGSSSSREFVSSTSAKRLADQSLSFLKSRKSIRNGLLKSKDSGTVVGIYSHALGQGMFITSVADMYPDNDNDEEIVVLKRYDLSGLILPRTDLSLSEIKAVCEFDMIYKNPILNG